MYLFSYAGKVRYNDYQISGPYTHKNLSLFFIHGDDNIDIDNLLTLDEAVEQDKIIIYETGNVSKLEIENISKYPVFIQAGDIVKGGRQDRVLQYDIIIWPGTGKISIASFCVERQRWSKRGSESDRKFESSKKMINSRRLKLAVRASKSQGDVWSEVGEVQERLSNNVGKSVKSRSSVTSLQLSLEDEVVQVRAEEYIEAMMAEARNQRDVIGFAFAINGEINSADLYGSSALFKKVWPKMIEACAIEALSELDNNIGRGKVTLNDIANWFESARYGEKKHDRVGDYTHISINENDSDYMFETVDDNQGKGWIHQNIIRK
jgi:hypothetical protein